MDEQPARSLQFGLGSWFRWVAIVALALGCAFHVNPLLWLVLGLWVVFIALTVAVFFIVLALLNAGKAMFVDPLRRNPPDPPATHY